MRLEVAQAPRPQFAIQIVMFFLCVPRMKKACGAGRWAVWGGER